jgi:hypothetical protein
VLAGRLVAGAALAGPVVGAVVVELGLELLLQPAAASTAATAVKPAKPSLLCLRTVVPPWIRPFTPRQPPRAASASACDGGSVGRIRLPSGKIGVKYASTIL